MNESSGVMTVAAGLLVLITTLMCAKLLVEVFFNPGAIPGLIVLMGIDVIGIRYLLKSR